MATPTVYNSVSELHRGAGLAAPQHPLISIANYADISVAHSLDYHGPLC